MQRPTMELTEAEPVTEGLHSSKRRREEEGDVAQHNSPFPPASDAAPLALEMADDPFSTQQIASDSVNAAAPGDDSDSVLATVALTRRSAKGSFLLHDYPEPSPSITPPTPS